MQHLFHLASGPVSLRPLEPEDAGLLLTWLTDANVLEYWEGPSTVYTPQRIQEDFYTEEWNASRCIIGWEGQNVGYVQIYQLDDEMFEEYHYPKTDKPVFGIDQFIALPALWGKGIGRAFLRLLTEELHSRFGAHSVVLDPHADNVRAIRCYEACGFRKVEFLPRHEQHEGEMVDCWLMALKFPEKESQNTEAETQLSDAK